jgi:hypothetical protein
MLNYSRRLPTASRAQSVPLVLEDLSPPVAQSGARQAAAALPAAACLPRPHREPPRRFELCADGGVMLPGGAFRRHHQRRRRCRVGVRPLPSAQHDRRGMPMRAPAVGLLLAWPLLYSSLQKYDRECHETRQPAVQLSKVTTLHRRLYVVVAAASPQVYATRFVLC